MDIPVAHIEEFGGGASGDAIRRLLDEGSTRAFPDAFPFRAIIAARSGMVRVT